ncbi:MAG: copper transporter [Actinomycetota bacterium]|nr:copper transporter [Actinomycetota bacterium]
MISFRYHLVTIVAVFLALGLGLLAGTTVIKPGLVQVLQKRTREAELRAQNAQQQVTDLQSQVSELIPFVVSGRLPATDVVIVTYEGSDGAMLSEAQSSLHAAGANVLAVLPVTSRVASTEVGTRQSLAKIVHAQSIATAPLQRDTAVAIARRLTTRPGDLAAGTDLLGQLVSGGFIRKGDISSATLRTIGAPNQVVVALTGSSTKLPLPPQSFMVPLVEQLVGKRPVAAGQTTNTADPFVPLLRSDTAVPAGEIVTIDDLEQPIGGAALVLGLDQLLASPADGGGSYGVDGSSLIPTPAPIPTP